MADLIARVLGRAALRRVEPKLPGVPDHVAQEIEDGCLGVMAAAIGARYPSLAISGEGLRERLTELLRDHNQVSRLRLKYGWHDAEKVVPNHSRHVLVWTQRGEYRAWYDHKWHCWRIRRDGLTVTHWREQCGPENWPGK